MAEPQDHSAIHMFHLSEVVNDIYEYDREEFETHLSKMKVVPISKATKSRLSSTWLMDLWMSSNFCTSSFMQGGTNTVGGFKLYKPRVAKYIGSPPWNGINSEL